MASRVLLNKENKITQGYSTSHKAVDLARSIIIGAKIIAHSEGTVVFCQTGHKNNKKATGNASYGNCVKIDHGSGYATLYAHLSRVDVKLGDKVEQGQVIGVAGNTGRSFGTHLHFEVRKNNSRIDPTPYLEADLPSIIHALYKAYAGKWLSEITDSNDENTRGFAGIRGKNLTALMAKAGQGILRYRVHLKDGKRWLNWIEGYDASNRRAGYAGNKGQAIDAVQMELVGAEGYQVQYRVSTAADGVWHDWYTGLETKGGGYAGVMGEPIDRIQIRIVKV